MAAADSTVGTARSPSDLGVEDSFRRWGGPVPVSQTRGGVNDGRGGGGPSGPVAVGRGFSNGSNGTAPLSSTTEHGDYESDSSLAVSATRRAGGGGGGGRSRSNSGSASRRTRPADDRQEAEETVMAAAAARAAKLKEDKFKQAVLQHFVAEDAEARLLHGAGREENLGSGTIAGQLGTGTGTGTSVSASRGGGFSNSMRMHWHRVGGGSGSSSSDMNNNNNISNTNNTNSDAISVDMGESEPPVLPSGELLEEGSKAWKLLGAGNSSGTPRRQRPIGSASGSDGTPGRRQDYDALTGLFSASETGHGGRHYQHQYQRKTSPNPPPPMHPRLVMGSGVLSGGDGGVATDQDKRKSFSSGGAAGVGLGDGRSGRPERLAFFSGDMDVAAASLAAQGSARIAGTTPYWTGVSTMSDGPGWGGGNIEGSVVSLGAQTPPPGADGDGSGLGQLLSLSPTPLPSLGAQTPPPGSSEPISGTGTRMFGVGGDGGGSSASALRGEGGGSRSRSLTLWADSAKESESAAASVAPPSWGLRGDQDAAGSDLGGAGGAGMYTPRGGGSGRISRSATSTPRGVGSNLWGAGVGVTGTPGRAERRGEELNPVGIRTPGRLPRRLHQGVNKVKRAVGVG